MSNTVSKLTADFGGSRLLEGAGRDVMADVTRFFSRERLERAATANERVRLARELHDGVLQSLTGAVLQLEALSRLMQTDPEAARKRLQMIEELISEQQHELRMWVDGVQPDVHQQLVGNTELVAALEKLRQRIAWQWGIEIELVVSEGGKVPRSLGDEIYRLAQEALTNIGRHARAKTARIRIVLGVDAASVHITVSDDGSGFPFRGSFDLAELTSKGIGPRSLRERVAALGGELVLTSELSGSRLEISLPINRPPLRRSRSSSRS